MGSVSERTAESSPVPTLVVRSETPFDGWLRGERPLQVFVGFDFTVTSEAAVGWVRTLLEAGPCDVTVGYTNWPPHERDRFGVPLASALANPPAVQQALERDLQERVAVLLGRDDAQVRVQPGWGRADAVLIRMAGEAQADLIVTGTHQRHGLPLAFEGSVSRGLLHHSPVSVACVPVAVSARGLPRVGPVRRVVVATDFSPVGNRAIAWACSVTQPGGTVRAIHVVHPREIAGGQYEHRLGATALHRAHVQAVGRRLQALLPADTGAASVAVEASVVEHVDPEKGIYQEAERYGADLIVMGSGRRSGLQALLGSVTRGVMAQTRRPVLVVPSPKD